ncbi:N-acetylglucosamine-6-phosphate deacetylase [Metabacillus halosaccharovorans]|uniref:N-acetylglucosamine-6-phosphate deacetylase n=1 Tax=Metabacillus halosaccharovorans TaxID=930124 RepID=UPI001C1F35D8|nr:N-acetylglucosamine-6-phosphate deacetylase [Metabacillus halosaccharovorans]MBU7590957.1 N-acetylglucosamine-6-phosphate deacetylase [Metabacillus halosaccharovorans]
MEIISNKLIIKQGTIYTEEQTLKSGLLQIDDGKITKISKSTEHLSSKDYQMITLPEGYSIIPGMIDLHIHGVNGADTMDATREALDKMASTLPKEGTTSFLATTITEDINQIKKSLLNAGDYINSFQSEGNAEVLGIHLEGPFIHKGKAGAQPVQHIADPDTRSFKQLELLSNHHIKLVTLAPELPGGSELLDYLKNKNIVSSIAHSEASYSQVLEAIDHGLTHVTHLFNQMTGLHHRDPGIVGSAFLRDELMVEIIADGIHVSPEIVKVAYKQITDERMMLITDAMRAKWLEDGSYDLGGQMVTVTNGKALLDENTLAGSVLKMIDAFKNIQTFTGCSMESAIKMACENPAKQLNVFDRKGSIANGKDADLVILDENKDVYMTICKGKIAFTRGDDNLENH